MTESELITLNFKEIRRRSIKLWRELPEQYYYWKPDQEAMSAMEMIRHVVSADHGWNTIINKGDMSNYRSPWEGRPYLNLDDELEFAKPHRQAFLDSVRKFSASELATTEIIHPGNGQKRKLGDYLLRTGYHEAVHAGQFLSYLRAMGVKRPHIWD
ncbi:DinB family protein [Rapidithrix thailandica]|uniref:DinB family protein n=1 Tax=Rapidithrix thailandica TaxID=413964 RepID=A0AAW9S3K8_9BACT